MPHAPRARGSRIRRSATAATAATAPFPLLTTSTTYTHVSPGVCDACASSRAARASWVALLLGQLPSHRANAERTRVALGETGEYIERYERFERAYDEYLSNAIDSERGVASASGRGDTLLDMVVEKERLLRENGLEDMFYGLKTNENEICVKLYPEMIKVIERARDSEARLKIAIEGALAGNLFDAGAAAAVQNVAFCDEEQKSCDFPEDEAKRFNLDATQLFATFAKAQEKVMRPEKGWRFDDFDAVASRASGATPWKRVLIFCDNAGADTMGMVLLARYLASVNDVTRVALVANETAALNDITAGELRRFVSSCARDDAVLRDLVDSGRISCVSSGQTSTLLDLSRVSRELCEYVQSADDVTDDEWLIVLDGMGRSLESNWNAYTYMRPGVDVLSLAMVKSEINALRLGAAVYDCVVRLNKAR